MEENNNIITNSSKSDISRLLTLSSADAKSTLFPSVPSLTKIQARNFSLLNFPRWLCLIHRQFDMYLCLVKRLVICKCQSFCLFDIQKWRVFFLSTTFSVTDVFITRDSGTRDVLRTQIWKYYKTHYCCIVFDLNSSLWQYFQF